MHSFKKTLFIISCNFSGIIYAHAIKVLLAQNLTPKNTYTIKTSHGATIAGTDKKNTLRISDKSITIKPHDKQVIINNQLFALPCTIMPSDNQFTFKNHLLSGALTITKQDSNILLINTVDLEWYVARAVQAETYAHWPLEMLKAQAIASRSYAVSMMLKSHKKHEPYDVTDSTFHQKSSGGHPSANAHTATQATKDIILGYKEQPVLAMFSSCCGSIQPSNIGWVNFNETPYLKRTYACTYCKNSRHYRWKTVIGNQELNKIFGTTLPIQHLEIAQQDKAGIVTHLTALSGKNSFPVDVKKLYTQHKGIKSYHFTISQRGAYTTFYGDGFGHHLGLCQSGATEMARLGWNYKKILNYYYPKTYLMKLS